MAETRSRRLHVDRGTLYGRSKELGILETAFERANKLGIPQLILVEGAAGTGKSMLLKKAFKTVCKNEPSCISVVCTFESQSSSRSPLSVVAAMVGDVVASICSGEPDLQDKIVETMKLNFCAGDRELLLQFIPAFQELLSDDDSWAETHSQSQADGLKYSRGDLKRVGNSLREFFLTVTRERTVVICVEHLQWGDPASLQLIDAVINDHHQKRLLFAGTCRDENENTSQFFDRWKKPETNVESIIVIQLRGVDIESLIKFLADVMDLEESNTYSLAPLIMARTNGNIFFVQQLLEHFQNEGLLFYDCASFRWRWDVEKVQNSALSENVVNIVASRIQRHPQDVQQTLKLIALLGYKADPFVIEVAKGAIDDALDVFRHIDFCIEERLLEQLKDGRIKFFHDKIHQAVLSLLPDNCTQLHCRIGELLWDFINPRSEMEDLIDARLLFTIADQLNKGIDHVDDISIKLGIVELNLEVGNNAAELSAFETAGAYFEKGISGLDGAFGVDLKWSINHALCMSLYTSFAEVQYYLGMFHSSLEAIECVLCHHPAYTTRMQVSLLRLQILKAANRLQEFVSTALALLEMLDESIPSHPSGRKLLTESKMTTKLLNDMSMNDIIGLPRSSSITVQILCMMMIPLEALGMHDLCYVVVCRVVRLSIVHGNSEHSPYAFAIYGAFLISNGKLSEGSQFGEIAIQLSKKLHPRKPLDPSVAMAVYSLNKQWQRSPLSQCIDPLFEGHITALKRGDPFMAFMCINTVFAMRFYSSLDLRPLLIDITDFSKQMLDFGQKMAFLKGLPLWQCILNLSGASNSPLNMSTGTALDQQHLVGNEYHIGQTESWAYLMQIAYYLGDLDLAAEMSSKLQSVQMGFSKAYITYPPQVFFFGLIAIAKARSTGKRRYRKEASNHLSIMRQWAEKKASNFLHKLYILEAEFESLQRGASGSSLRGMYDNAISASSKMGFVQDTAIASLRAGETLLRFPELQHFADAYILKSECLFRAWGANVVADKVRSDNPLLCEEEQDWSSNPPLDNHSSGRSRQRFSEATAAIHLKLDLSKQLDVDFKKQH